MNEKTSAFDSQVGGSHYKHFKIQPIFFCQENNLLCMESSAIQYICRHRFKNKREDIEKAIHCLQMLLEHEYPTLPKDIAPSAMSNSGQLSSKFQSENEYPDPLPINF